MSCTLECYRTLIGAFCSVLQKILTRKARIAAGRVRGLRVNSYAASIAMATLLVLLMIGGVEPHPGPTDDKIANGKRDSTSSANDGNHNDRGNANSPPKVDQLFAAISEVSEAVNRVEAAQAALSTQQTHNTAAVQQRLAEVEKKLDERLKTLEDSNDVLSADVGEMSTKVEQLEEENQFIKDRLRNLEEKLDSAENHSKRNNLLFYGIPTAAGETWSDCEDKVMNIIKTDMKITDGVAIERAHRVGKAIIIKLLSYKDKEKILKGAKNLASTNKDISVREDFSQAVQTKRSTLVPMMKTLRKDGKRARLRFDILVTDDGTFTFNLQTNLIEKLDGDRRSRSKTTASWNGSGNTKRYNEAGDNDSDSNVWGNLHRLQHKSRSRRHTGRDGSQINTPSTSTERRQWSRVLRSEVRQQYTPVSKRRAGVRDHGTADAGGAHPQRMDTDRSA